MKLVRLLLALRSKCTSTATFTTCALFVDLSLIEGHTSDWGRAIIVWLSLKLLVYVFIYPYKCNRMLTIIGLCAFKCNTTFNNGSLGSRIDEERSEMR